MRLDEKVAKLLITSRKTLAIAESCTGGLLSHRLTNTPGSSHFLKFTLVAYSNESKIKLLKVPTTAISKHGAVSSQVAILMAEGIRKSSKSDFGIGITGIAGPNGGTKLKPVGLIFISVSTALETICLACRFKGSRTSIKSQAATQALRSLYKFLI